MADGGASIDRLTIEITSNATSAVSALDALSKSLHNLKGAVSGETATSLRSISTSLVQLKAAAGGLKLNSLKELNALKINKANADNLRSISQAIALMPTDVNARVSSLLALKSLSGLKVSDTIGRNLTIVGQAVANMPSGAAEKIRGLSGLGVLSTIKVSNTIGKNLASIGPALASIPNGIEQKVQSLMPLKQLSSIKLSGFSGLNGLGDGLRSLERIDAARVQGVVNSLRPLQAMGNFNVGNFGSFASGLAKLPNAIKNLNGADMATFTKSLERLEAAIKRSLPTFERFGRALEHLPKGARTIGTGTNAAVRDAERLKRTADRCNASMKGMTSNADSFYASFSKIGRIITVANIVVGVLGRTLGACVTQVNDFIENMNLFEASMGSATEEATEFGMKCQELLGIDFSDWSRNQGVFQTLLTGMGETVERATVMSQQLTQLGYDIASFFNINTDEAMLKVQSGISGELEPLRRLGFDLSDARMKLEATKLGLDANTNAMTQAEKVALRYHLIMTQVTQMHGDMARTIASPSNQLRVLQAQAAMAARSLGSLLIPAMNAILPVAIAVMKAIQLLANAIASFFGIDTKFEVDYSGLDTSGMATGAAAADDLSDSVAGSGKAAEKAKKKLQEYKNTVMGFDELNKLNETPENTDSDSGGSGGGAGGGIGDLPLETYDFLGDLDRAINRFTDQLAQHFADAAKKIAPVIAGIASGLLAWKIASSLPRALEGLRNLFKKCGKEVNHVRRELIKVGRVKTAGVLDPLVKGLFEANKMCKKLLISLSLVRTLEWGALFVGIGVLVAHFTNLYINSENFRKGLEVIGGVLENLSILFDLFGAAVGDIFLGISAAIGTAFDDVGQFIADMFASIGIDITPITTFVDAALGVLKPIGEFLWGMLEGLDIQWSDFAMVAVGALMMIFKVLPGFGQVILIAEAVSLAIRAIGYAASDCVQEMDPLADVSTETAEKIGDGLDNIQEAQGRIDEIDFADAVVSEEDVADITKRVEDVRDIILNNLDSEKNEQLAALDSLKAAGYTDEEIAELKGKTEKAFDAQKEAIQQKTDEAAEILRRSHESNEAMAEEDAERLKQITDELADELVKSSGASAEELKSISAALKNNKEQDALKAAETVIQKAEEEKNARIDAAASHRDQLKANAEALKNAGEISEEEYNRMTRAADDSYRLQEEAANQGLQKVKDNVQNELGEAADKFDVNTGKMKSNWDMFCSSVDEASGGFFSNLSNGFQEGMEAVGAQTAYGLENNEAQWTSHIEGVGMQVQGMHDDTIATTEDMMSQTGDKTEEGKQSIGDKFSQLCNDIGTWWDDATGGVVQGTQDMANDAKAKFDEFWGDISAWYNDNIEPWVQKFKEAFQKAGDAVGSFMSDPVGTIKQAWNDLAWWFYDNVGRPLSEFFNNCISGVEGFVNAIIDGLRHINVDVPEPLRAFTGGADHVGFGDLQDVHLPRVPILTRATGGFVNEGQLFIANERGPEMIGRMGQQNVVANNAQIVEGIESGVTSAMLTVLPYFKQSDADQGDVTLVLRVGNEELARATAKGNASLVRRGQLKPQIAF